MSSLKLIVFGSPQVDMNGERLTFRTRKALALLVYLAVTQRPHSRETLAALFWPDFSSERGFANLRNALRALTRPLSDAWFDIRRHEVAMKPDPALWVDALEFQQQLDRANHVEHAPEIACEECVPGLLTAIDLYRDEFLRGFTLPDCPGFDEWQSTQADVYREHLSVCFRKITTYVAAQCDYARAIHYAQQWVTRYPWSEAAYRELMRVYSLDHQRSAALQQYQTCVRMLQDEFGVEPEHETQELYEAIVHGPGINPRSESLSELKPAHCGGSVLEGALASLRAAFPNNLPAQTTGLIGREAEVETIIQEISRPDVRLLTLTGPGGIGKTRLGLQVAAKMCERFADGVFFVPLAAVSNPAFVIPTIIQTLGLQTSGNTPPLEVLTTYLKPKHMLIVLDNFEQVLEAANDVYALLTSAPDLMLLITSRAGLRLSGEHEYSVPPLTLPEPTRLPALTQLTHYEAVQLFLERARAVKAGFTLTSDNAPAVAEICVKLDGLPLAIELTAARIKLLAPQKMLPRLDHSLQFLTGGARNLPARQRTIRGTIEWSYDLLEEHEKTLFRRLSVFAGGWTIEAAEQVCALDDNVDVFAGLETLLNISLIEQHEVQGEGRLTMLETIRQYALEQQGDSGEAETIRRQHAQYFLKLSEAAEPRMYVVEQLDKVEMDHHNFRSALAWSLDNAVEIGVRLAAALGEFWIERSYFAEGREWFTKALAHSQACGSDLNRYRAKALGYAGTVAVLQGDYTIASRLLKESETLYHTLDDTAGLARVFNWQGVCTMYSSWDLNGCRQFLEKSLALSHRIDDTHQLVQTLHWYGEVTLEQGDYEQAESSARECLALAQSINDLRSVIQATMLLGRVTLDQKDYETAQALFEKSLRLSQNIADKVGIAFSLAHLGAVFYAQEQDAKSALYYAQAVEISQKVNSEWVRGKSKWLGFVLLRQRCWQEAYIHFVNSLMLNPERERLMESVSLLTGFAGVAEGQGKLERAAQLLGATETSPGSTVWYYKVFKPEYDRIYASVRRALGEDAFEAAAAKGRDMTPDEVIAFALEEQRNTDITR